jgi:threonine dehydrogenase-like Zn-dependent dehydrogenase
MEKQKSKTIHTRATNKKGADVAIDAVGRPITASQAVDVLKPAGRTIIFSFRLKPSAD